MRFSLALCTALLMAGCSNSGTGPVPPKTVDKVDLEKYQGTWFEAARLPMFFQRNCAQSEAHYTLQPDGKVGVLNRCRTLEGKWEEAKGVAEPQVKGETDKLWVTFDNWVSDVLPGVTKGQYWVLYLDDDYTTAMVGSPDHEYLWLLSRTPELKPGMKEKLLDVAKGQGYETGKLIWRTPDGSIKQ